MLPLYAYIIETSVASKWLRDVDVYFNMTIRCDTEVEFELQLVLSRPRKRTNNTLCVNCADLLRRQSDSETKREEKGENEEKDRRKEREGRRDIKRDNKRER